MPLLAFRDLVANKIPEQFPGLRFGFIEAAAGWAPFLIHIVRRLLKEKFRFGTSADMFREYRLYIACEADEDIPYLAEYTGEDHLLIGSDYPHSDPSREDQFVNAIKVREDISPQLRQKILYDNPRAFYACKMGNWNNGILEYWIVGSYPSLHHSNIPSLRMLRWTMYLILASDCLHCVRVVSAARSQEVFIGNPGKSLNFFHFDLAH